MATYEKNTRKGFAALVENLKGKAMDERSLQIAFKRFLLSLHNDLNDFETMIPKSESGPFYPIYEGTLKYVRQTLADNKQIEVQNAGIIERFKSENPSTEQLFKIFYWTLDQEGIAENFNTLVKRQILILNAKQLSCHKVLTETRLTDEQIYLRKKFRESIKTSGDFESFLKSLGNSADLYLQMVASQMIIVPRNLLALSYAFSKQYRSMTVTPKQHEAPVSSEQTIRAPKVLRGSKQDMAEVSNIYFRISQEYLNDRWRLSLKQDPVKIKAELPGIIVTHRTLLFAMLQDRGLFPLYVEMVKCGSICIQAEFHPP